MRVAGGIKDDEHTTRNAWHAGGASDTAVTLLRLLLTEHTVGKTEHLNTDHADQGSMEGFL